MYAKKNFTYFHMKLFINTDVNKSFKHFKNTSALFLKGLTSNSFLLSENQYNFASEIGIDCIFKMV